MTTDSNHERAALSARDAAKAIIGMVSKEFYPENKVTEFLADRDTAIEQRARLEGETEALREVIKDFRNPDDPTDSADTWDWHTKDYERAILSHISPEGRSLVEKREAELCAKAHKEGFDAGFDGAERAAFERERAYVKREAEIRAEEAEWWNTIEQSPYAFAEKQKRLAAHRAARTMNAKSAEEG